MSDVLYWACCWLVWSDVVEFVSECVPPSGLRRRSPNTAMRFQAWSLYLARLLGLESSFISVSGGRFARIIADFTLISPSVLTMKSSSISLARRPIWFALSIVNKCSWAVLAPCQMASVCLLTMFMMRIHLGLPSRFLVKCGNAETICAAQVSAFSMWLWSTQCDIVGVSRRLFMNCSVRIRMRPTSALLFCWRHSWIIDPACSRMSSSMAQSMDSFCHFVLIASSDIGVLAHPSGIPGVMVNSNGPNVGSASSVNFQLSTSLVINPPPSVLVMTDLVSCISYSMLYRPVGSWYDPTAPNMSMCCPFFQFAPGIIAVTTQNPFGEPSVIDACAVESSTTR